MLGRTHFVVATATALAVLHPQSVTTLIAGTGAAALGGVISDIDVGTSEAHQGADRIIAAAVLTAAAVAAIDGIWHVGIADRIRQNSSAREIAAGLAIFLIICMIGKEQPHRSFMHSFLAMLLLSAAVNLIFPDVTLYFMTGFASHLAIDLMNRKGEKLFFPLKKGFCLHLCSSRGIVNRCMGIAGFVMSAVLFLTSDPMRRMYGRILMRG